MRYGAGSGGNGDIGGGSGGDGARAIEGRSLVLSACLASGLSLSQSTASGSLCSSTCMLRVLSSLPISRDDTDSTGLLCGGLSATDQDTMQDKMQDM